MPTREQELAQQLSDASADVRADAMDALVATASPALLPRIRAALDDTDARVRSHAARAIVRLSPDEALEACLRTLNDNADELHADMTPSVASIARMGLVAVEPLLDRLLDADEDTRMRAQRALEGALAFSIGANAESLLKALWLANGNYDWLQIPAQRGRAVTRWREWLKEARTSGLAP